MQHLRQRLSVRRHSSTIPSLPTAPQMRKTCVLLFKTQTNDTRGSVTERKVQNQSFGKWVCDGFFIFSPNL